MSLPNHANVVIIGGGVAGCSTAYHLTKLGITDVLHKLPSTSVFITQAEGLDADKYKETRRKVSERRAPRREGPLVYVGLGRGPANTDQSDEGNLRR